jgi:enoyl-CoA hydratase/carnithine racemase
MGYEHILYEVKDRITTVTLNRPEKLNAWTTTMGHEVKQAMTEAGRDEAVRAIVLTGSGRGFCGRWMPRRPCASASSTAYYPTPSS